MPHVGYWHGSGLEPEGLCKLLQPLAEQLALIDTWHCQYVTTVPYVLLLQLALRYFDLRCLHTTKSFVEAVDNNVQYIWVWVNWKHIIGQATLPQHAYGVNAPNLPHPKITI